jgi:hypothetical protein
MPSFGSHINQGVAVPFEEPVHEQRVLAGQERDEIDLLRARAATSLRAVHPGDW